MKKLIITITLAVLYGNMFSQVPGTSNPNGSTNTSPGTPVQPYNGTNPAGVPNQNGSNSTVPDPTKPATTYPNNTAPATPGTPATPGSTYPPATPGTPNTTPGTPNTSPAMPNTSPVTPHNNKINRLYQDPARTPREPQTRDQVRTVDGSTGKYKSSHKVRNSKGFATNSKHVKKSKKGSDNGREKTNSTTVR